ncbi:MAG: LicD family protein [Selenomonadaceae bacterium]|nr:LicD family protein [Selenomonadaceae bacterium]
MGKAPNKSNEMAEQNKLLREQNDLLREQNELIKKNTVTKLEDGREIFIDNIDRDEIRNGFLVTSQRKKLWNVQIALIKEFDRICKKHNLRWFAIGGTLIGAARHKGFIPWDDDVDVAMLRPDYDKFRKIVASEVRSPYVANSWYDFRLEDDAPSNQADSSLTMLTTEQHKKYPLHYPFFPIVKIRDSRTFYIEIPDSKTMRQNVFLDIFPMDSLPPFEDERRKMNFEIMRLLYIATTHPESIRALMKENKKLILDYDTLNKFIAMPYKQRGMQLEKFLGQNFFESERVGDVRNWCIIRTQKSYRMKDFADVVYLPFEKIQVPAPANYDSILTDFYGDWRTPVFTHSHVVSYSVDISWDEYIRTIPKK